MSLFGETSAGPGDEPPPFVSPDAPLSFADAITGEASGAAPLAGRPLMDRSPADVSIADLVAPPAGAGERLVRMAYRLGLPASTLVSPFRKPPRPRLLAIVDSPVPGDRVAGMALRAGHFLIGGTKLRIEDADFAPSAKLPPIFAQTLHGFSWLRDLAACAPPPQCAPTAERVLGDWLDTTPHPGDEGWRAVRGAAWNVEHAARRLLAWLVHAPLILSGSDKAFGSRVLARMEATARWLDRNARRADDRHGEALAWCAVIAAGLLLPQGEPRRLLGEAGLVRALGEMVSEDGGVLSRSPLAQMDAIAMLVDLAACYRATRRDPPRAVEAMLALLVPPLLTLRHADGSLGNWQGSGAISGERTDRFLAATGIRSRPLAEARAWGYQRLAAQDPSGLSVLVCDAAPAPMSRHSRCGCASTLAFEFSHGEHCLVVNCGGAALAGGQVPARIEQGLRASAAHSTLILGDANSTAVELNGALGKGVTQVEVDRQPLDLGHGGRSDGSGGGSRSGMRLELAHDGYGARFGLRHRRVLVLRDDGRELLGEDSVESVGRRVRSGRIDFAIRFHLGPNVDPRLAEGGLEAELLCPDGSVWLFESEERPITVEESLWVDGGGRPHPIGQLVIGGLASRGGASFGWRLVKTG